MLIDSHCHIDGPQFDEDRDDVVVRAEEAGVAAMLNVGTGDPHTGEVARAVEVAERYNNIYASVGVHPHDAKLYDDKAEEHLIGLVKNSKKVVAWGEIGLDYYYDHSPRDVQQEVFRRQVRVAKDLGLPIIIHTREADDDTLAILKDEYGGRADTHVRMSAEHEEKKRLSKSFGDVDKSVHAPFDVAKSVHAPVAPGVMHCFGGTPEMAEQCIELGFYISFAGNVTFKKAENLRDAARVVPLERLLVETDCPYLTPVPFRGKRNEPEFVVHTARFLAEFYGISFETLAHATTQNFIRLFGIDESGII